MSKSPRARVVIVGAGFGGLAAAKALGGADVDVTLVDRTNHHLFQPLLYQVATAALSPSDIAAATRTLVHRHDNIATRLDEVCGIDTGSRTVLTASGARLAYDYLVLATGCRYSFFGHDDWAEHAFVLKTLPDALGIRERLLASFELAESSTDEDEIDSLLTFVVIGGGPTGVEMAGAIAELARSAVRRDYRAIAGRPIRIVLIEGGDRLLSSFPEELSRYAAGALARLGVELMLGTRVDALDAEGVLAGETRIETPNVVWAAGTRANPAADWLGTTPTDGGRIEVLSDCSVRGHGNIFAIGDLAHFVGDDGRALPGLAPVAKQQGKYVGRRLRQTIEAQAMPGGFRYRNWGSMAVIGRSHAVGDFGAFATRGFLAWLAWSLVHLMLLVDFRSRSTVYVNWAWSWFTKGRGVRLLTGLQNPTAFRNRPRRAARAERSPAPPTCD